MVRFALFKNDANPEGKRSPGTRYIYMTDLPGAQHYKVQLEDLDSLDELQTNALPY
jgi:hypothetical protein